MERWREVARNAADRYDPWETHMLVGSHIDVERTAAHFGLVKRRVVVLDVGDTYVRYTPA